MRRLGALLLALLLSAPAMAAPPEASKTGTVQGFARGPDGRFHPCGLDWKSREPSQTGYRSSSRPSP